MTPLVVLAFFTGLMLGVWLSSPRPRIDGRMPGGGYQPLPLHPPPPPGTRRFAELNTRRASGP